MKAFLVSALLLVSVQPICANSHQSPDGNLSDNVAQAIAANGVNPSPEPLQEQPQPVPHTGPLEQTQAKAADSAPPAYIYAFFYAPQDFRLNAGDLIPFSETTVTANVTLNEDGSLTFPIPGTYEIIYGASTSSASGVPANGPVFALFSDRILPGSSLFTGTNYGPGEPKMTTMSYILSVAAGQNLSVRSLLADTRLGTGQFGPPMGVTAFISVKKIYP